MTAAIIILSLVAILLALWLFLVAPAAKHRDMSEFLKSPIAHRGMHDDDGVPENSIPAFALAIDKGYPIEIDLRVSKDEDVFVVHDNNLNRLCGSDDSVSNLTATEVESHRLTEGGEKIPTLRETLDFVNGRVPLLIELKGDAKSTVAERSYEILKDYNGTYAIQSFTPELLGKYRRLTKSVPIGILAEKPGGRKLKDKIHSYRHGKLLVNYMYRPDFISYCHHDPLPLSAKLCKLFGATLLCWTVKEKDKLERARGEYDGFICEKIGEIF